MNASIRLGDLTLENAGGKNKETLVKDLERMDSHYMMKKKELQGKILELEKTLNKLIFCRNYYQNRP